MQDHTKYSKERHFFCGFKIPSLINTAMLTPRPAALYGNFVVFLALVVVDLRLLEDSISIGSSSPPFDEVASLLEASLLEDDESTIQNKAIHVISVSDDKS